MKKLILPLALVLVASFALAQTYDANGRQKVNVETGTTVVTQGTGTNLHAVVDSGTVTVSDGAGALNVIVDSATLGTVTVSDGAGALNTIVDSGTLIATQATGTNLHTVVDSGSVTVSDGAGALNVIVDSATLGTVTVSDGAGAMNTIVDSGTITTVSAARIVGNAGAVVDGVVTAAASPANMVMAGGIYNSTLPSPTTGQSVAVQLNAKGMQLVQVGDGTTNAGVISATTALKTDLSSIAGTATPTGNGTAATSLRVSVASDSTGSLIATQATAANLNARSDTSGATGAAPPARADFTGGIGSGATGGLIVGVPVCDTFARVNVSTAATTLIITGVSGRHVRICSLSLVTAAANIVTLIEGTGATCGTGTTGMAGGTTTAGYSFAANGGIAYGSGIGSINSTTATGDSVCIVTSAATQLSGAIGYTIY